MRLLIVLASLVALASCQYGGYYGGYGGGYPMYGGYGGYGGGYPMMYRRPWGYGGYGGPGYGYGYGGGPYGYGYRGGLLSRLLFGGGYYKA